MKILGFLGSPRLKGKCSKLLDKALEGAASKSAEIKKFELIKYNIQYCRGCGNCYLKKPELSIGICPLKDDMALILEEYTQADGYIFASPVYDMFITALMKTFVERMIALTYKPPSDHAKIPDARTGIAANFTKMASIIITGNCADELREVMGEPCFESFDGHLMIQQVDTVDTFYVGGLEYMTDEIFEKRLDTAYQLGVRLVEKIEKARQHL